MNIIVGLGNPGAKFNTTPHNVGFMAVDVFATENKFSDFTLSKKYHALVAENETAMLVKPETFMNESGKAVKKIISNFKFQISNLVVVHDDIDLPLGTMKFSKDSGSGGHKGVDSIIAALGNNHFIQLKIGIATNEAKAQDVVLKKFTPEEMETVNSVIEKSAEALQYFIKNGLEKTMNEYNR